MKPVRIRSVFAAVLALLGTVLPRAAAADVNRPFGSHPMAYAAGTILPGHLAQADLDEAVRDFYDAWKAEYLEEACGAGRYVVRTRVGSGNLTVSEGHGYGMMLAALMAGHDPEAQTIFDGMFAYFREHPTAFHDRLMAWNQATTCRNAHGDDSATDGDLDIAFALLLADKQWGSCGRVDYRSEALAVLDDVLDGEVDPSRAFPLLGDWVEAGVAPYGLSTRSSDFMVDHFASFADATGAADWNDLRDSLYDIVDALQSSHSAGTGLLPDFIVDPATSPAPAPPGFLEGDNDGAYSYNACRVPWRLATDFVANGDPRAHDALAPLNAWIRSRTAGDPDAIRAGYRVDGSDLPGTDYRSLAFVAPLGAGAMVDAANQAWLDDVWDRVVATPLASEGYYENTLKLLSMIVMSGNWWAPDKVGAPSCTPVSTADCTNPAAVAGASVMLRRLDGGAGAQTMLIRGTLFFPAGRPAVLDSGAQILVEDIGNGDAAIFDLRESTVAVPGNGDPACDAGDAWKSTASKVLYRNRSGSLGAPTCDAGSANGLARIELRSRSTTDVPFTIRTARSTIAMPSGPLRVTLVLGDTAAAGAVGNCGVSVPLACSGDASRLSCR